MYIQCRFTYFATYVVYSKIFKKKLYLELVGVLVNDLKCRNQRTLKTVNSLSRKKGATLPHKWKERKEGDTIMFLVRK